MSSSFDDLSQDLTAEEKKNLLGKIQVSLNLSARDTDSIVTKAEGPEELHFRLDREVEKLGAVERFFVKVAAFFFSRTESEIMVERKLALARSVLREKIPDMINFTHREWTPELAKTIYDLLVEMAPLKPAFEHLFHQKLTLEAGLLLIFREEHPTAARDLSDLLSDEEIASLYRGDQKRSTIQNALTRKLQAYFESVPDLIYEKVKDRLRPLYYLKPLVLFPYNFVFDPFGHNPDKSELAKYPFFIGAPWPNVASLLERLYYGLYLATKIDWREGGLNQLLQGVVDRLSDEKQTLTVDELNEKLVSAIRLAQSTAQKIPWREVLQWSFQNPYYSVKFVLPKFSVRDFYETTLTLNFEEELSSRVPEIRRQLLAEERTFLFEENNLYPLEYYVSGTGAPHGAQVRVEGFQHTETLGLLWGFLSGHYTKRIQPFYQSLSRLVAPASKSSLQLVGGIVEELTNLKNEIFQFDRTLHPDSPEGKEYQKLRYELSSRAHSLKPFVQLVQKKDGQAMDLVDRGLELLSSLEEQFVGIRDRNVPALKSVLGLPYLLEGRQELVENGLTRILLLLQKIIFVIKEARTFEG